MAKYSWVRTEVTLSDREQVVERWQAPFFDAPVGSGAQPAPADLLAVAQASGFQEGRREGLDAGREEAEKTAGDMLALVEEMAHPFRSLDQLVIKELSQLAMLLAEKIVGRELSINSEIITQVVADALSTLSSLEGGIEIFLNPKDARQLRELAPDVLDGVSWKLVETSDMLPGGCRVKTPVSLVDASVEKKMEQIFSSLLESSENALEC